MELSERIRRRMDTTESHGEEISSDLSGMIRKLAIFGWCVRVCVVQAVMAPLHLRRERNGEKNEVGLLKMPNLKAVPNVESFSLSVCRRY
jgi:hypothetical protein